MNQIKEYCCLFKSSCGVLWCAVVCVMYFKEGDTSHSGADTAGTPNKLFMGPPLLLDEDSFGEGEGYGNARYLLLLYCCC